MKELRNIPWEELSGNIEGLLPPRVFDAPMICLLNGISIQ